MYGYEKRSTQLMLKIGLAMSAFISPSQYYLLGVCPDARSRTAELEERRCFARCGMAMSGFISPLLCYLRFDAGLRTTGEKGGVLLGMVW